MRSVIYWGVTVGVCGSIAAILLYHGHWGWAIVAIAMALPWPREGE